MIFHGFRRALHSPAESDRKQIWRNGGTSPAHATSITSHARGGRSATHWCRRSRTNSTAPHRCRACAPRCGTRSIGVSTDGLSRLSVGGATPSRIARIEKIASTAPAAPSRWPIDDLVDDIEMRLGGIADQALHRAELDLVAQRRRGAVGVDVVDVARRDAGALDRRGHAAERAVAVGGRRGDVEGVARHAVADQLGIDLGAARLGVLVLLQHDDAGALAHDESRRGPCRRAATPWSAGR